MPDTGDDLATLEDFTDRLGRPLSDGAETARAQAALDDASAFILTGRTFPDPVPRAVIGVTCSLALRVFRNPDELTSETIDDYTYRRDATTSAGLSLTPAEEQILERCSTSGGSGLWTQKLTRDGDEDLIFGYDQNSGDPILLARGTSETDAC